ncbi:hypothetical protein [Litorihabitans aurantiacus]|uniref:Uncharacterized protein n=1 Tax=Litorihabitans aurantiacus TaxID=1930061 RepID=A0AA38CR34_9MICO|nr:hypothetical protein [Litorihabitans aurantiacus]GMA31616.1 hypothetical protein GCM10025875_16080 [Litorihabitans aurantiacus]
MAALVVRLWRRVHEPRAISVLYLVQYLTLTAAGGYALWRPPSSIEGAYGAGAMLTLAALLVVGGLIGAIAVLPGKYELERLAVIGVALASLIYVIVIVGLHATSSGNRLLQAGFVAVVLLHQGVRWVRIKDRPFRPRPHTVEA